jgi:APA family basic amino acid/polyamine antiporter
MGYFFPAFKQANAQYAIGPEAFTIKIGGAQILASILIAIFTILNCFGVSRVAKIQNVLTFIKVTVLLAFIGLGFLVGAGNTAHFSMAAQRTSTTPLAAQFAISLFWIYVSYSGWNAATYVAEELKRPERTLPAALTIGTALVAAIYVGLNLVFVYATPLETMKGVVAVGSLAASHLFGPQAAGAFSALMGLSLLATVNAMVTIGPRVYYAMAKNGAFLASAAKVDSRWHTPVFAILCQGLCAILMTLTPFPQLVVYIGFTLNFTAVLSVVSLFIFRRRAGWQKLKVVSFAWPLFPLAFLLIGLWMTYYGMTREPKISAAAVLTLATGAAVYHFRIRGRQNERN